MALGIGSALALGAASSALSSAGQIGGGLISNKQQYEYSKEARLKGPGWDVKGLRDAGLNPILAAAKFGGATGGSPVSGFSVSPSDIAGSTEKFMSSSAKKSETTLKDAQTSVAQFNADSAKALAEIDKMREDWEREKYAFMHEFKDDFLPIAASSASGYSPRNAVEAAGISAFLSTSKKINDDLNKSKPHKDKPQTWYRKKGYTRGKKSYGVSGSW